MRNDRLDRLAEFPFRRLAALLAHEPPPRGPDPRSGAGRAAARAAGAAGRDRRGARASVEPLSAGPRHARVPRRRRRLADAALRPARRRRSIPTATSCPLAGTKEGLYLLPSLRHRPAAAAPAVLMPDPVYAVYYRCRGHGRGGAGAAAGHGRHRLPARPRRPARRSCWRGRRCSTCARRPTRRVPWPTSTICAAPCASPAGTASCSRSTNATASSGTRRRRPARWRRRWPRMAASTASSCSTR